MKLFLESHEGLSEEEQWERTRLWKLWLSEQPPPVIDLDDYSFEETCELLDEMWGKFLAECCPKATD